MKRPLAWLAAAGILVAAGAVIAVKPQEQWAQGPIAVGVPLGVEGSGRNIEGTIHSVALADAIELDGERATTEGVWVIAEVTAANRLYPTGLQSFLFIDGKEFRGSERLEGGIEQWTLTTGIPTSGIIAFEIPRELATGKAEIRLGDGRDVRLDSVILTSVDLSELSVQPTVVADPARRVAP